MTPVIAFGLLLTIGLLLAAPAPQVVAESGRAAGPVIGERQVRRVLRSGFPALPKGWEGRLVPDETMAACADIPGEVPKEIGDRIKARERARIVYPQDGQFLGDWRRGEAIAQSGYGMRFTDTSGQRPNGGNCYACHQLSPDEVSYGTIGASLKGYGRIHKFRPEDARIAYEKIYNSQAVVPCSMMPRFGTNGILSIEQIKDLVALLMDPASPVNRADPAGSGGASSGQPEPRQQAPGPQGKPRP
jgi:sulfur-oxidizing protein SoxX